MGSRPEVAWSGRRALLGAMATTIACLGAIVLVLVLPQGTAGADRARAVVLVPEPPPGEGVALPPEPPPPPPITVPGDVAGPPQAVAAAAAPAPAPAPPSVVRALFLGDSVAWTTAVGVRDVAAGYGIAVDNGGIWGCGVVRGTPFRYFGTQYDTLPNDCDRWNDQWQRAVEAARPDVVVVMVGRWELMDRVHEGRWTHIGDPVFDQYLVRELQQAIAVASSRGAKVAIGTTPYYHRGDAPGGRVWPEDEPARVDRVNALIRQAAAGAPGVATVVDIGGRLSPDGRLAMQIDGVRVRTDGVHVAPEAGPWLAPWLLPQLRAIAGR